MLRLLTDQEVIAQFGDPQPFVQDDGSVAPGWRLSILDTFPLPKPLPLSWGGTATKVSCHRHVKPELERIFKRLAGLPEVWSSLNDYGGCYNFRTIGGNKHKLSRHSWGIAIDIDVADNPLGSGGEMNGLIIEAFYDEGWKWGGFWQKPDPMHFEKAINF